MKIAIKYEGTTLTNDPDYDEWSDTGVHLVLRCQHDNLVIEPPCCDGRDCDCQGRYSAYCPLCPRLSQKEADERIDSFYDRGDD